MRKGILKILQIWAVGMLWTDQLFVSLSRAKVFWETREEIFSKAVTSSPAVTLSK